MLAIYEILFRPEGLRYIGSTIDLKRRWRRHRNDLVRGTHHSLYLQRLWHKYGPTAFEWKVLEIVQDPVNLLDAEAGWIDRLGAILNTRPPGAFDVQAMLGARCGPTTSQICAVCGEAFEHVKWKKRYFCSPKCSAIHTAKQRRAYGRVSRFQGVSWKREYNKWCAQRCGKHLGYFEREEDAAKAYNDAAKLNSEPDSR